MRIHRFQARFTVVVYFTTFTVIIVVRRFIVDGVADEFVFVCHVIFVVVCVNIIRESEKRKSLPAYELE